MKSFWMAVVMGTASVAMAQPPAAGQVREPLPNMQAIADALGVQCEFCHSAPRGSGQTEPKKDIARQMLAMTREMNTRVTTATGKAVGQSARVDCVTCHRGVTIPKQLGDVIFETAARQSGAAAVEQYRDLRTRYYGRAAYDFGESTLISVAQRLSNVRPDDAILISKLNIEFFPKSSESYAALAYAYTRKVDDTNAIAALEKSVELNPENNVARGQLEQLKSYQRRK
ncbi:MAG: photosynthetic reaction center cytochrome c subunit family protein [Acidobacteriota bacterium]